MIFGINTTSETSKLKYAMDNAICIYSVLEAAS